MNIAMRKLAYLEKNLAEKEENARIQGYVTSPADRELRENITRLMQRINRI